MKRRCLAFAALVFAACGPTIDRGDFTSDDRGENDLDNVPQEPNAAVCNGGTYHCYARVRTDSSGQPRAGASGLTAANLADAYKLNTALVPDATIAIVDAYGYANAASDLAQYRTKMGLPACTTASGCLTIVNQNGAASPLPGAPPSGDDWTVETALDLDMASAACPNCKLLLIQAQDDEGNGLYVANNTAATMGATVVSNSWGGPESSSVTSEETYFNHPGIAYFVAAGDDGYNDGGEGPDYPSTSAYTVAVGGTTLAKSSSGTRGWTEGAWSDGGASCSTHIAKPSWQLATTCSKRATSDVAAVGDPNTGPEIYNAANGGLLVVGGTSAASPFVAAVYALYGKGNAAPGWAESHGTDFFDVTTGKDGSCGTAGCNAGAGWDGPTGVGTPNGAAFAGSATSCTPACGGKTCGDDGCGGSCGTCATGDTCSAGVCEASGSGSDGGGGGSGSGSGGGTTGGSCAHPDCSTGAALDDGCDACASDVCAHDDYCCTTAWDSICVGEAGSICGESCGGGTSCTHSECNTGTKLKSGCDSCVTELCAEDSYCCHTKWDSICVSEVGSVCGETCD